MKKRNLIALTCLALCLNACIPSVNPFYTANDVVFDARLLGEWRGKDPTKPMESWKFEKADEQIYNVQVTEKDGKTGDFIGHLFRLKQEHFLDLRPANWEWATNQADLVGICMFPGHLMVRVPQMEPELKLAFFDFEWLAKFLEKNPDALAHHSESNSMVVLTAPPSELQKFVLRHLGEGELFGKRTQSTELVHKSEEKPPTADGKK